MVVDQRSVGVRSIARVEARARARAKVEERARVLLERLCALIKSVISIAQHVVVGVSVNAVVVVVAIVSVRAVVVGELLMVVLLRLESMPRIRSAEEILAWGVIQSV